MLADLDSKKVWQWLWHNGGYGGYDINGLENHQDCWYWLIIWGSLDTIVHMYFPSLNEDAVKYMFRSSNRLINLGKNKRMEFWKENLELRIIKIKILEFFFLESALWCVLILMSMIKTQHCSSSFWEWTLVEDFCFFVNNVWNVICFWMKCLSHLKFIELLLHNWLQSHLVPLLLIEQNKPTQIWKKLSTADTNPCAHNRMHCCV